MIGGKIHEIKSGLTVNRARMRLSDDLSPAIIYFF